MHTQTSDSCLWNELQRLFNSLIGFNSDSNHFLKTINYSDEIEYLAYKYYWKLNWYFSLNGKKAWISLNAKNIQNEKCHFQMEKYHSQMKV